jgi:hypothetical protein
MTRSTVDELNMNASDNDALVERIRAEYLEMPGMTLRLEQVARLCGIERATCKLVLDALVQVKFLCLKPDGSYARISGEMTHRPRPAKATLQSYTPAHVRHRAS